jgi:hypothetical protein
VFSSLPTSERGRALAAVALALAAALFARPAQAAGKRGEVILTSSLGMTLVTRDLEHHTTRTVRDVVNLSEFVGLHGYVADRVRLGANLQLSERLWPEPAPGSRIQRFAVLPQIGWNFYDPFFTALVFGFAPRTEGKEHLNLSLQAVLGASFPISKRVRFSLAGELPWTFYDRSLIGFTALTGISIRL